MLHSFKDKLRYLCAQTLFPQVCIFCGRDSLSGRPLCAACLSDILVREASRLACTEAIAERCAICGRPLVSAAGRCTGCKTTPSFSAIDRILPLYPYSPEGQDLLTGWKLRGMRALSISFAQCFAAALRTGSFLSGIPLVPVPPRPGKIRDKGWDQVEELVSLLEKDFSIPVCRCLIRTTGIQQKKLGKLQRAENLKGHITVAGKSFVPETAIVLDDLMTTGATLDACAEALKIAGCRKVYGLTLFFD